tara:strand:+ start:7455 stop:8525 length:1071 start_codon:yes stop_codon:yes gene_type:complete
MNLKLFSLITFSSVSLFGCSLGQDSILFVTKTSVAIDIDTNPLTFDVGYGRYEGSIAPVANDGQVLPLLSSINAESTISSDVFGAGVSQNFGVGNAAVIMSQYLGSDSNPIDNTSADFYKLIKNPASIKGAIDENTKRYFFGTKTTLGFTTSFAPERGYMPDSITLGYKRKELAYVPIIENTVPDKPGVPDKSGYQYLSIPSMLATTGTSQNAGINKSGFSVSQFYATGKAANYLAANPTIRNSVISKIIGDDEIDKKLAQAQAEEKTIAKIDTQRKLGKEVSLKANNIIDNFSTDQQLDSALKSMIDMGIAQPTEKFGDNMSEFEKKTLLKKQTVSLGDKSKIEKIKMWISNNSN